MDTKIIVERFANQFACSAYEIDGTNFNNITDKTDSLFKNKELKKLVLKIYENKKSTIFTVNKKYSFAFFYNPVSYIVGPIYFENEKLSFRNFNIDESFTSSFSTVSADGFIHTFTFAHFVITGRKLDVLKLVETAFEFDSKNVKADNATSQFLFDINNNHEGHHTVDRVSELEEAIKCGNIDRALNAARLNLGKGSGITSKDELRNSKNMTIAGITIITRAAIKGGVHYEIAYTMSDSYISQIESVKQPIDVTNLYLQYVINSTRLVRESIERTKNSEHSNYYAEKVKKYLSQNISRENSVEEMAKMLNISPNYLSSIFKKCEGKSISQYVSEQKIYLSQQLMINKAISKSQIAATLGFASQSHFCNVFKKIVGCTPNQYLNNYEKMKQEEND